MRDRWIWEPAVVAASALFTVVFAWPASVQPAAWVWGSHGDGLGNIVEFSWFVQAIKQGLSWTVDPNLGIPFGERLGDQPHEPLYFWAQIAIGLLAGSVVALNILSLIALPAAAWAMYRLVFWMTGSPVGAFVSGIGFGCCGYVIANTGGETTLAQIWIFPAVILAILKLLESPSARRVTVAAAVVTLTVMINFYYVLFVALCALAVGASWLAFTALERRSFPVRPLLAGLTSGALALVVTIAIYQVAVANLAEKAARIHRASTTLSQLAASPMDFLLPLRTNPWFGGLRQGFFEARLRAHPGIYTDFSELSIALPILILAAAGLAIFVLPRFRGLRDAVMKRAQVAAILGIGLLGAWLLMPPFGRRYHLTFLSLEWDIWSVAPQYASFYRAGMLVVLAACVLAGIATAALAVRRPRAAAAVAVIAAAGIFVENFTLPADRVLAVQPLPEYVWVMQHPGQYAIADYPLLASGSGGNEYTAEFYQRFHGHPLLNGSIASSDSESMREELRDPNQPGVAEALAALNVRYVIWHTDLIKQFAPLNPSYAARLPLFEPHPPGYALVESFAEGARVYAVTAPAAAAFAFYAAGFGPVVAAAAGGWTRRTEAGTVRLGVYVASPGPDQVHLTFSCETTGSGVDLAGRALDSGRPTAIDLSVSAGKPITELELSFSPAGPAESGGVSCSPISAHL